MHIRRADATRKKGCGLHVRMGFQANLFSLNLTRCTAVCISFPELFIPEPGIRRLGICETLQ